MTETDTGTTVHGTALSIGGHGVLIRGDSGSGKSSLALALLYAEGSNAALVADDYVVVTQGAAGLDMSAPERLAGLIEVRGQGILRLPHADRVPLDLVVDLGPVDDSVRYPDAHERHVELFGVEVPRVFVAGDRPGGPARVAFALRNLENPGDSR